jgi:hypothetical protein
MYRPLYIVFRFHRLVSVTGAGGMYALEELSWLSPFAAQCSYYGNTSCHQV